MIALLDGLQLLGYIGIVAGLGRLALGEWQW